MLSAGPVQRLKVLYTFMLCSKVHDRTDPTMGHSVPGSNTQNVRNCFVAQSQRPTILENNDDLVSSLFFLIIFQHTDQVLLKVPPYNYVSRWDSPVF